MLLNQALKLKPIEFKCTSLKFNNICEWSPRIGKNTCASGGVLASRVLRVSRARFYFARTLARGNWDYLQSVDDVNSSSTVMRGQSYILKWWFLWRHRLLVVHDLSGVSLLLLTFSIFSHPELGMLSIFSRSRTKTWIQRGWENFPLMARHKSVSTRHGWNGSWIRGKILHSFLRIFIITTVQRISHNLFCALFFSKDVYETFNILLRRKPKENNFKVGIVCYLNSVIHELYWGLRNEQCFCWKTKC